MPAEILLAGPTAVGKSAVAMALANRLPAEILSVDSMQVYRGMDIGTAKPSPADLDRVPHHLVSILDLDQAFDAADFLRRTHELVPDILARGRTPILCGGTGLYFKAYTEGLAHVPTDPALRAELESTPLPVLLRELEDRDPAAFATIDQRNPRRVIRAVEAIRLTGKLFSQQRAGWQTKPSPFSNRTFILERSPPDLTARIESRVTTMFAQGLVEETRRLIAAGLEQNRTAMQALGYRQAVAFLRGESSLDQTIERVKARTRQFARRQMTWFRGQMQGNRLPVQPTESAEETADRILSVLSGLER